VASFTTQSTSLIVDVSRRNSIDLDYLYLMELPATTNRTKNPMSHARDGWANVPGKFRLWHSIISISSPLTWNQIAKHPHHATLPTNCPVQPLPEVSMALPGKRAL
jgi:hypothetical protein